MPVETTVDALDPKQLLAFLTAIRKGDFSVRLPGELGGIGQSVDRLSALAYLGGCSIVERKGHGGFFRNRGTKRKVQDGCE
ncbi:MAG: hypothetical protein HYY84_07725 [Deltaproteobacteria bacterium]|nr:hypothetical protein [Deltaproteobacteria bacterium]